MTEGALRPAAAGRRRQTGAPDKSHLQPGRIVLHCRTVKSGAGWRPKVGKEEERQKEAQRRAGAPGASSSKQSRFAEGRDAPSSQAAEAG